MSMLKHVCLAAIFTSMSGCMAYQMNLIPGGTGADVKECPYRPHCDVVFHFDAKASVNGFGREMPIYGSLLKDPLASFVKETVFAGLESSGCLLGCMEKARGMDGEKELQIDVRCELSRSGDALSGLFTIFTLGVFPGIIEDYRWHFQVQVRNAAGMSREYRLTEVIRERGGLLALFAAPFAEDCGSRIKVLESTVQKIMSNLMAKMQRDGFFSAEARDKAMAGKTAAENPAASFHSLVEAERRKNLDSLLESGVISEEEYRKEMEKEFK